MFKNITYISMSTSDLSTVSINAIVNKLYSEAISKHLSSARFAVQLQLKVNDQFRSASKVLVVSPGQQAELKQVLALGVNILYSHYQDMEVSGLFIRYNQLDLNDPKAKLSLPNITAKIQDVPLNESNTPKTIDLKSWGFVAKISSNNSLITGYIKDTLYSVESKKTYDTDSGITSEMRFVTILDKATGVIVRKFVDYIPDINLDKFTRTWDNKNVAHYENSEQNLFLPRVKDVPFVSILDKDINYSTPFVTLDIETCKMNSGDLFIESVAISTEKGTQSWHILDYSSLFGDLNSCTKLLKDLLDSLIQVNIIQNKRETKWVPTIIYVHNFSKFDAIFLIKFLVIEAEGFKINRRDGNILSILWTKKYELNGKIVTIKLIFKDSYLLLNASLARLAKTFNTELKGDFDTLQIVEGYDRYFNKNELLKYNIQDCIVLRAVIVKFGKLI